MAELPVILDPPGPFEGGILFGDVNQPLQGIFEDSVTQKYELGTQLVYKNGRKYRYAQNGAAAGVKASMMQSVVNTTQFETEAQATSYVNATVGQREFVCDITTGLTLAENYLAQGVMVVNKVDGLGDIYTVLANKIQSSDILMRVLLDTPIRTALVATSELTFVAHKNKLVIAVPNAAQTGPPAGVMLIAATANYFCWLQTGGTAAIIVDTGETVVIGEPVGYSAASAVDGACGPIAADTDGTWGICRYVGAAAETALVELNID